MTDDGFESGPSQQATAGLLAKVQLLLDRQEIRDCVHRYARGLNRHDDEVLASAFHEDATFDYGAWTGKRDDFVQWANHLSVAHIAAGMHHITSHTCTIEGDVAYAESYVLFVLRYKDPKTVQVGGGRYLDRLERREGVWRIAYRHHVLDNRFMVDGSVWGDWDGYVKGTQDRDDASYAFPAVVPRELLDRLA